MQESMKHQGNTHGNARGIAGALAHSDWRPLLADARRWIGGHRLAVTATVGFVMLNLIGWIVAAAIRQPFPLRLHTTIAVFDPIRLALSLILARGMLQLVADAVLLLVMLSIAERSLGRRRTLTAAWGCAVIGVAMGTALCAAIGWLFQDSHIVDRMAFTLTPLVFAVGPLMAASAFRSHLWRRRIRLIGYAAILVTLLYGGNPGDYCMLAAALAGHAAGHMAAGKTGTVTRNETWHWWRGTAFETRRILSVIGVVMALGPLTAIISHTFAGPLSTLGLLMSPLQADDAALARCLAGTGRHGCFMQFNLLRASMPGAVLRSLLPTIVMLILVWGLYRGRRFAALATAAVNLATVGLVITYYIVVPLGFARHDWMSLMRHGVIVGCLANALPPLLFAIALLASLRSFPVKVGWRRLVSGSLVMVVALLSCSAVYLAYGIARPGDFTPPATSDALLAELPGRFLPIGLLSLMRLTFAPRTFWASAVYQGVGLVFWIVVVAVVAHWMRDMIRADEKTRDHAERLVEAGGESMSFMTTWEGNDYWLSAAGRSAVAYRVINGVALTCTGPFGDPADWRGDLVGFARFCAERSWTPVFYSVHRAQRDRLLELGWHSIEVGSEMVVDPRGWKTTGKKWQDIRTAINKAKRVGITDVRTTFLQAPADVREQIEDISEQWAQSKALPEMRFTLGGVEELRDPRVQLLYAVDGDGRVQGVTSWLPTWRDGRVIGWTLDFMRHRPDSPNGVMEFLIARMAERLRDEGQADPAHAVEFMSLSAAPLAGMDPERDNAGVGGNGDAAAGSVPASNGTMTIQHALQIVADLMEPAYGFRSLFNFKRKFQPAEDPVYVCYPDPAMLPQIGLAIVHAYVPSVTPSQLAGMLDALRA